MGEETTEEKVKPDLTLFRRAQQEIGEGASNKELFKEVLNEDIKKSIGNDGNIDKSLFGTVQEYVDIVGEPFSVGYYGANAIYNDLTESNFKAIDKYVLDKIKTSKQKPTPDVYNKVLKSLEGLLNLSGDHETMHRIKTVFNFIEHGINK
jgi:hypothetical protein